MEAKIKFHMLKLLFQEPKTFDDYGEINCTILAERTAEDLDLYLDKIDYVIPEEVFDMAVIVAENFK